MTRRVKYNKPLHILAETNGLSISTLEHRLRLGMDLKKALSMPIRSKEVTKKDLLKCQHLTFSEACKHLGIQSRKLNRLSETYDIYFRRTAYTYTIESKVIVWCAVHCPVLKLKHMARFVTEQLGFEVTENQIRYRLPVFGFTVMDLKKNRDYYQKLMLNVLWSND